MIGPAVDDFANAVRDLVAAGGLLQCRAHELTDRLRELVDDPAKRRAVAEAGRDEIRRRQGASERTAAVLRSLARERSTR